MDGGGDPAPVVVPGPSAEERDLQRQQAEMLALQRQALERSLRQEELFEPLVLETLGITPIRDNSGAVTGYEKAPDPLAAKRTEIEGLALDRSLAALKGELPVNPAVLRDLDKSEQSLRDRLIKQLGPGFETSSPGIEALNLFEESKNITLEGARRGDLTLAEQISLARGADSLGRTDNSLNKLYGFPASIAAQGLNFGRASTGYTDPISAFRAERELGLKASMFNAQLESQQQSTFGQVMGGFGKLAGVALGSLAGPAKPWFLG